MTGRVRRLLRVQQDFVADASHQLRTPLTGLRLRVEGLAERFRDDPAAGVEIGAALREVDRLSSMVDELLILSRAGEHELPAEQLELAEVAARAGERWGATAAERGIAIEVEPGRRRFPPPGARGRSRPFSRCPDRERLALLAIRCDRDGRGQAGTDQVLDRGPGLEAGEEESVFERFSRGSAGQRGPSGTGLGLAIARELTRQWGGEVSLRVRDGGGLRAIIEVGR